MTNLLRENIGEFTWSPTDMLGLDRNVAIHKLNIDPNAKIVVQKKRMFTLEK